MDLVKEAIFLGFSGAAVMDTKELVFVPEYRTFCEENLCLYGPALMIRISVLPSAFIFSASSSVILFCSNLSFLYCAESCMSSCMVCSTSVFS